VYKAKRDAAAAARLAFGEDLVELGHVIYAYVLTCRKYKYLTVVFVSTPAAPGRAYYMLLTDLLLTTSLLTTYQLLAY